MKNTWTTRFTSKNMKKQLRWRNQDLRPPCRESLVIAVSHSALPSWISSKFHNSDGRDQGLANVNQLKPKKMSPSRETKTYSNRGTRTTKMKLIKPVSLCQEPSTTHRSPTSWVITMYLCSNRRILWVAASLTTVNLRRRERSTWIWTRTASFWTTMSLDQLLACMKYSHPCWFTESQTGWLGWICLSTTLPK